MSCVIILFHAHVYSGILGVVTLTNMSSKILKGNVKSSDKVTKVLYNQFEMVSDYSMTHVYSIHSSLILLYCTLAFGQMCLLF